jgi:ubiquinone/menaquinone biosynthesis C-methylase UbiE
MDKKKLAKIVDAIKREQLFQSENDKNFFCRVFNSGDLVKYEKRIRAIGFSGKKKILDAGCGFAQWSFALSEENNSVVGIDIDRFRIDLANIVKKRMDVKNLELLCGALGPSAFKENEFDGIFSYNSITLLPYRQTLRHFHRVLEPGGHLYFNSADLGWFIYNIIEQHNPAADFSPRQWAIDTIRNTINYYATGIFNQTSPRDSLLIPVDIVQQDLRQIGFEIVDVKGDGGIDIGQGVGQQAFFPAEKYGMAAVYEILCRKR